MTPREKFIQALRREPIEGHVPHFELVMLDRKSTRLNSSH